MATSTLHSPFIKASPAPMAGTGLYSFLPEQQQQSENSYVSLPTDLLNPNPETFVLPSMNTNVGSSGTSEAEAASAVIRRMCLEVPSIFNENQKLKAKAVKDKQRMRKYAEDFAKLESQLPSLQSMDQTIKGVALSLEGRSRMEDMLEVALAGETRAKIQLSNALRQAHAWRAAYDDMAQRVASMRLCSHCCGARDSIWRYSPVHREDEGEAVDDESDSEDRTGVEIVEKNHQNKRRKTS
ncbi:uncharacterized protein PV09_07580 [Verruconis gallopava]|uniref:Uncharacterized protein n=1 Tax=Verruconis gallopava TaxID=253628 RepID=A0A0D1YIW3_9PEZI|nr:uncharacterized protein PV09_07580 [Verruconis gallopava]KIW00817.1 hypothetical protein PV09_07580 [Verruconis gallopava]